MSLSPEGGETKNWQYYFCGFYLLVLVEKWWINGFCQSSVISSFFHHFFQNLLALSWVKFENLLLFLFVKNRIATLLQFLIRVIVFINRKNNYIHFSFLNFAFYLDKLNTYYGYTRKKRRRHRKMSFPQWLNGCSSRQGHAKPRLVA